MDKNEQIKYINAYNRLCQNASIASFYDGKTLDSICKRELDMFRKLIKESFELVEKYENCTKELTHANKEEYVNTLQRPYKLEELKTGMWIWDNKLKNCFLIHNIINKEKWQIVVYRNYLDDIYDILNFEENRFFPVEIFDKGDCKNEN